MKRKPDTRSENTSAIRRAADACVTSAEVLTLSEAAAYLRVPEPEVIQMVKQQNLPGRLIGEQWRFLKSALQDWLRIPAPRPSKEAVLSRIGNWQNDPYLEQELEEIHKRRGRPLTTTEQ